MKKFLKNTFAVLFILAACFSVTGCQKIADYVNSFAKVYFKKQSYDNLLVSKVLCRESAGGGWDTKYEYIKEDEDDTPTSFSYILLQPGTYDFIVSGYSVEDGKYFWSTADVPFTAEGDSITIDAGAEVVLYYDRKNVWVKGTDQPTSN